MARHLFFAITLIVHRKCSSTHRQKQLPDAARCEDQAANCWADVPTPLVGRTRTNACATATGR